MSKSKEGHLWHCDQPFSDDNFAGPNKAVFIYLSTWLNLTVVDFIKWFYTLIWTLLDYQTTPTSVNTTNWARQ